MDHTPQRGRSVPDHPEVSIIVLVVDRVELLVRCLDAVADLSPTPRLEVIVVANGTPAEGVDLLSQREDIVMVRSPVNLGFAGGCNWAARIARGRYLALLNDDTEVEQTWLHELVAVAASDPRIASVGSRLLNADGSLQEAGGIIWSDGGTHRVGHGLPAGNTSYNDVRDVDYCSGCGLLVRREAWDAVGGLDERYFPAYHEDVDLALSLRSRGYRTVYAPRARLRHHDGASTSLGYRTFAAQRSGIAFIKKWSANLGDYEPPPVNRTLEVAVQSALRRTAERAAHLVQAPQPADAAKPSPPTYMDALEVQVRALRADLELKDAYVTQLMADKAALDDELRRLRRKVARLFDLVGRLPFGRVLSQRLSRRLARGREAAD